MMSAYGRFEILLPLRYNDGRIVPRELLAETAFEIRGIPRQAEPRFC